MAPPGTPELIEYCLERLVGSAVGRMEVTVLLGTNCRFEVSENNEHKGTK